MQPDNVQQTNTAPDQIVNYLASRIMELTREERKELLEMWKNRTRK